MISIHKSFGVVVIDIDSVSCKDDPSPDGQCYFFENEDEADRNIGYKLERDKGSQLPSVFLVCDLDSGSVNMQTGKVNCLAIPKYMVHSDCFPNLDDEGWLAGVSFEAALQRAANKFYELRRSYCNE